MYKIKNLRDMLEKNSRRGIGNLEPVLKLVINGFRLKS